MSRRIDWKYWRDKYVTGDDSVTYDFLCTLPNAPVLGTIRNRASRESWGEQRENFRLQKVIKVTSDPAAIAAAEQVNHLVNVAAMITQHDQLGRALEGLAAKWLEQFREDPERIKRLPARDVATLLKIGLDTRRLAAGMSTDRQEVENSGTIEVSVTRRVVNAQDD